MISYANKLLNSITMYKLALYSLWALFILAVALGFAGKLPYSGWDLLISGMAFSVFCYGINLGMAKMLKAPATAESSVITGFILFLIMPPVGFSQIWIIALMALVAMWSKYFIAIKKKHLFNPAALVAVVFGFTQNWGALWWVANPYMAWLVLIVGLLIVKKTQRFPLVFACWLGFAITYYLAARPTDIFAAVSEVFISWPLLFFSLIMLTEPSTLPPKQYQRFVYGFVIGLLMGNPINIVSNIYTTPEIMLVLGNIYSFCVGLKMKVKMALVETKQLAEDAFEFAFKPEKQFAFEAGQYMEWSIPHGNEDVRGIRRYFTISSAPQGELVKVGVRFSQTSSTFKKHLRAMQAGDWLYAGNVSGDFTLSGNKKYGFVAGGIGITPFISMIREAVAMNGRLDAILFYANKSADIPYKDLLDEAQQKTGLKVVYINGMITEENLMQHAGDAKNRTWYLSGPNAMVDAYKSLIRKAGVSRWHIKTDYFPGY